MLRKELFGPKNDVWALGCLLEVLWTHLPVHHKKGRSHPVEGVQELEMLKLLDYNTTVRRGLYAKYYYTLEDVARSYASAQQAR